MLAVMSVRVFNRPSGGMRTNWEVPGTQLCDVSSMRTKGQASDARIKRQKGLSLVLLDALAIQMTSLASICWGTFMVNQKLPSPERSSIPTRCMSRMSSRSSF